MRRLLFFVFFIAFYNCSYGQNKIISLSGNWEFKLDSTNVGQAQKWFLHPDFSQTLKLPGTLDDRGIGRVPLLDTNTVNVKVMERLSRRHRYIGAAWYKKEISVNSTDEWNLLLERVIWKTDCWIDGVYKGSQESLIAPQTFQLGKLKKGKHILVLRIDNTRQHDITIDNVAMVYTDDAQIIWNGIIGLIQLKEQKKSHIEDVQLYPDIAQRVLKVNLSVINETRSVEGLTQVIEIYDGNRLVGLKSKRLNFTSGQTNTSSIVFIKDMHLWDEFKPGLYLVKIKLVKNSSEILDEQQFKTGFRQLTNIGSLFQINGRRLFLRGTLDCNVYPLEGHPPMDKTGWIKVFKTAKNYGLNHIRFHSWCPPDAAFQVADSLGFYLHVELPLWSLTVGKDKPTLSYLEDEAQRIIRNYGNHPSFCFWSMGNELEGDFNWLNNLVIKLKNEDKRRLYTSSTFSFQNGHGIWPEPVADYFVTQYTKKGWVRGQGIFNTSAPDFKTDYSKAVDSTPVPLVIHEMGQYSVYPDLEEVKNYKGVLDPLNFKAVRFDLKKKDMLSLAKPFMLASGKLAVSLYKEEIERALKTPGISGFQLLDLHDFPGQGTALVGILNAFWESKGLISEQDFRNFCSPVVPLLRFPKAAYTNKEEFVANAQLANFGNKTLTVNPIWTIADENNKILFHGQLKTCDAKIGNNIDLGQLKVDLNVIQSATQLTVTVAIPGTGIKNDWRIWVYPEITGQVNSKVKFTTSVDEALTFLKNGEDVVLNPDTAHINGVPGRYAPVFWSPVHFPDQPGTMGLLCDVNHPALKDFPTAYYSDWQWWDLVTRSKTMITDVLTTKIHPVVRVIDNFFKNRNMADVLEFRCGKGKLIICSMDIHTDMNSRPAARQLKYSLMNYAGSSIFNPADSIDDSELRRLFK